MYFRNREVIELLSGTKYIVVENILYNDIYYYYLKEVEETTDVVKHNYKIITTVSENGRLFVKTVNGDLEHILKDMFEDKLDLKK